MPSLNAAYLLNVPVFKILKFLNLENENILKFKKKIVLASEFFNLQSIYYLRTYFFNILPDYKNLSFCT